MTVVCAAILDGQTVIGCDTLISTSSKKIRPSRFSKLVVFDNFIIGAAGTNTVFHVLDDFHKKYKAIAAPKTAGKCYKLTRQIFIEYADRVKELLTYSKSDEDGCSLLVVTKDKIFSCDEFSTEEFTTYQSIGSGESYALGSLHSTFPADDCVEAALKAACYYDKDCGEPLIIEVIKR